MAKRITKICQTKLKKFEVDNMNKLNALTQGSFLTNENMSNHTSYGIGGPAKAYVQPKDEVDLANILKRPLDYNNHKQLREIIRNHINLKSNDNIKEDSTVNFIEEDILIKFKE